MRVPRFFCPLLLFCAILGASASAASPRGLDVGDRAFILCWHSFLGNPDIDTDFSLAELGRQLDSLLALGYRFVRLEDALFGRIEGRLNLVATIDDGNQSLARAVYRVFESRDISPALFIYPAVIGSTDYSLTLRTLLELRGVGCLVGAHGYHHLFVTEELYHRDRAAFDKEIYRSRSRLQEMVGDSVYVYAYPFGAFDDRTKIEVAKAGYAFGLAVRRGFVFADSRLNDPYDIPRSVVLRKNWTELLDFLRRNARGR